MTSVLACGLLPGGVEFLTPQEQMLRVGVARQVPVSADFSGLHLVIVGPGQLIALL